MAIRITEACADTQAERLYLKAVIDDGVYIKGSQTLIDPPEYGPGLFQADVGFDYLPEEFNPHAVDLVSQLVDVDLDGLEWIQVDTSDY